MPHPTLGVQAIDATEDLLRRFADVSLELTRRDGSLTIESKGPGAFTVSIYDEGDEAMIAAERWHAHYDDPLQCAFCAMWLLTPFYRVVSEYKGALIASAWIERYEADGWIASDPAYFLNPEVPSEWDLPEGRSWRRVYKRQFALPSPQPYAELCPGAELDAEGLPPGRQTEWQETGTDSVGLGLY